MGRLGGTRKRKEQDESDTGDKNIVEGVVQKLLVFFDKNLNKIANLDQKTWKKKTIKGKLGKDSMTSSLYKVSKCKLSKVSNPSLATTAGSDLFFLAAKTVKHQCTISPSFLLSKLAQLSCFSAC